MRTNIREIVIKYRLVVFLAVYVIITKSIFERFYILFIVDNGVVGGDITYHFFVAGMRILEGESPYISPFITHPPLMLLLFAALLSVHAEAYTIAISFVIIYLSVPYICYITAKKYLSEFYSIIATVIISLNPLTLYSCFDYMDDDPLIMIGLMAVFYLYRENRTHASIIGAIMGGFKFIPLLVVAFLILVDTDIAMREKAKLFLIQISVFGSIMLIGYSLWGIDTLTRLLHYSAFVGIEIPSAHPFNIYYMLVSGASEEILRIISMLMMILIFVTIILYIQIFQPKMKRSINFVYILVLLAIYIGNITNSYMYFIWIVPFISFELISILQKRFKNWIMQFSIGTVSVVSLFLFGFLLSEWEGYTYGYGEEWRIFGAYATIFAYVVVIIIAMIAFLKMHLYGKRRECVPKKESDVLTEPNR
ncbi:MAG: hypothetical protein GF411_02545 [Candidatus Lokiarchaeota archaeon]|nr:hypothetical protein [Candidatus Lokiarchaeota archaeon]